ncbi:DUF6653 family protein [Streptomyces sp. O3]
MGSFDGRVGERFAKAFHMTDEAWRRHANPWSVWTRFAAVPALLLAVWSRAWIGWFALVPVALVVGWLWLNPRCFRPVDTPPRQWSARGVYGERLWVHERSRLPRHHRTTLALLAWLGPLGGVFLVWGLAALEPWPVAFGCAVVVLAQLWRIDHFGWVYEQATTAEAPTAQAPAAPDPAAPDPAAQDPAPR